MIDREKAFNSHLRNLNRLAGNGSTTTKYSYILSENDLIKAYNDSKRDLPYPLRKEVKRDRYILNAEGLGIVLAKVMEEVVNETGKEITETVADNVVEDIVYSLNNLKQTNGNIVAPKKQHSFAADLGKMLGRELVKTAEKILEDNRVE